MLNFLTSAPATTPAGGGISMIVMLVGFIAILYFFMIRPENKRKKEAEQMRNSLSVGDSITTIGGIVGTVVNIKDDKFVIETGADQVRIEFCKWALSTNDTANDRMKEEQKKLAEEKAKAKAARKAKKEEK